MNTQKSLKQKAFTLIELLVVVAIISLITSIVLASLSEAREKAQVSAYRSYLKQVISSIELWRIERGDYYQNLQAGLETFRNSHLSNYIEYQNPPSNLFFAPGYLHSSTINNGTNDRNGVPKRWSCGRPWTTDTALNEPFIIRFYSNKSGLNMPRLYYESTPYAIAPNQFYYCVSLLSS